MILVEGPRGSGKKTLVNKLALQFDLPVYDYTQELKAHGHVNLSEIRADLRTWESKKIGLYAGHPLINEYIYGPLLRKQVAADFLKWDVRPMIEYLSAVSVVIYCRPSYDINDPALPFFDLLLRTPLTKFRAWEHDYVIDPNAHKLESPLISYLTEAQLDSHHKKIGSKFYGRRKSPF